MIDLKRTMLDVLACTICKHAPLELEATKEDGEDVRSGLLRCRKCNLSYPIEDGIPDMLPPETCKGR